MTHMWGFFGTSCSSCHLYETSEVASNQAMNPLAAASRRPRVMASVGQQWCRAPDRNEYGLDRARNMTRIVVTDAPR